MLVFLAGSRVSVGMKMWLGAVVIGGAFAVLPGIDAGAVADQPNGPLCKHALPATHAWAPQETWAWSSRICRGERADMSAYGGGDGDSCDAAKSGDWPAARKLSARFLDTILNTEPYRGALHRSGVHISCATFPEPIDLSNTIIDRPLRLTDTVFSGDLSLTSARIRGQLSLDGSVVTGLFTAERIRTTDSLFMRGASFRDVRLIGAEIGGSLHLRKGAFDGDVDLTSASIADELQLNTPPGKDAHPRGYGPPQWADGSRLILRNTRVGALNDTIDSWDGVTLDLVGFTYARLGGLRATKDSIMAARPSDWLLNNWLAKQDGFDDSFIPQPFEQLAKILRESGYPVSANEVLLAKLDHWRDSPRTATWTKASLWLQYVLIGYGYRNWQAFFWFIGLVGLGAWVCGRSPAGREMQRSRRFWYSVDIAVPLFDLDKTHAAIKLTEAGTVYFYFHKAAGFVLISFVIAGLSGLTK